ncbi:MAG: acetyltransferase [Akkermansiaceae bacterium]|nr:acetyltransferase [Akkermansiaceae bacterium]
MKPVIIIGGGGHAKVVASTLQAAGQPVLGFTDTGGARPEMSGIPQLGGDEAIAGYDPSSVELVFGIGCIQPGPARAAIFHRFKGMGYDFRTVVHPTAWVAPDVEIGEGTVVFAGAIVQPGTRIGVNTILNSRSSVDHDCRIGSHVHIAPGAVLSGAVVVGDGAHLGVGCTIIQGLTIGGEALVGAGSVVVRDVAAGHRVFGVPARPIPGGGA